MDIVMITPLIVNALILIGVAYLIVRAVKRNSTHRIMREQEIKSDQAELKRRVEELEAEIEKLKA